MLEKPTTAAGYRKEDLALVRATCLYIATKLGDLMEDLVVVGGLVPSLLVDLAPGAEGVEPHVGTMDLVRAMEVLRRDFLIANSVGPRRVAQFLERRPDDTIQADVVGFIGDLIRRLV